MPVTQRNVPTTATESDIATNHALLQHAEATRLAKSWLNGFFNDKDHATNTTAAAADEKDDDDEREDLKYFGKDAYYSETGGVGFRPAAGDEDDGGAVSRRSGASDSTTFLRKQLLRGGRGGGGRTSNSVHSQTHNATTARPRGHTTNTQSYRTGGGGRERRRAAEDLDEDNEECRSGLGKEKKKGARKAPMKSEEAIKSRLEPTHAPAPEAAATDISSAVPTGASASNHTDDQSQIQSRAGGGKKRGTSYLDELLAIRAAKKNKKQRKKQGGQVAGLDTAG